MARAVMLTDDPDRLGGPLAEALRSCVSDLQFVPGTEMVAGVSGNSWLHTFVPGGAILRLLSLRPDLVIASRPGAGLLQAVLYRLLRRQSRLLLWSRGLPAREGTFSRWVLRQADAVLVDGAMAARVFERLGGPRLRVFEISDYSDIGGFSACPARREGVAAHRIVHVGNLTPQTGVADLLIDTAAWAERHPEQALEIWWVGEGDLRGVLEAQPLPLNLTQRFLGSLSLDELPETFSKCGLLAVPTLMRGAHGDVVPEALAAGLPVIGSVQSRTVRSLIQDGENGWLFDPLKPDALATVLDSALNSSEAALDRMRVNARAGIVRPSERSLTERISQAITAVLSDALATFPVNAR